MTRCADMTYVSIPFTHNQAFRTGHASAASWLKVALSVLIIATALSFLLLSAFAASTISGAHLTAGPIPFPGGFMTSVKSYGAVGNGVTDDTAAIQAALSDARPSATADYNGLPKALYFPPGIYLVHDTLTWNGCCVTLQGDGTTSSVIRLVASAAGYGDAAHPKSVVMTAATNTNESFRQNIWDLGISVGPHNPGAIALSYVSNNVGSIRDVAIRSEDGEGVSGLDLTRKYPGPMMVKDLSITGFQTGISTCGCFEYSATIEGLTLAQQSVAGIDDWREPLNIRNLLSLNKVPGLIDNGAASVLIEASFNGGNPASAAIQNNGSLYLRDVTASGYSETLAQTNGSEINSVHGAITEYTAQSSVHLFSTASTASLRLPIEETPAFTVTNPAANWVAFTPRWYGDTSGLQALLNSGKSTIYFPFGRYFSYNEAIVTVPETVQQIAGFSSIVNMSSAGTNGGGIDLVIEGNSQTPLIIQQFGYGIRIEHRGSRPVVLKDGKYEYTSYPGAGNLFLDDVVLPATTFQPGQTVWARQLDDEVSGPKITNRGKLWLLGLKTEGAGSVIQTEPGASTELLGALLYPATTVSSADVALSSTDAAVSYIFEQSAYCATCGYVVPIEETLDGVSQRLTPKATAHFVMPLFVGTE